MVYTEFLMSHLLLDVADDYKDTPYDELFDIARDMYERFESSEYDRPEASTISCMVRFIKVELNGENV